MNSSINFSHFADLLVYEYSKEKEIQQNEMISQENFLAMESPEDEALYSHIDPEMGS